MTQQNNDDKGFALVCVIVSFGQASRVVKHAKQHGIRGATIFLGKGTVKSSILKFLEIDSQRKEIVLMAADRPTAFSVMEALNDKFEFKKPNHGIAFSTCVLNVMGTKNCTCAQNEVKRGVDELMYKAIFTIVDKGNAEKVIESANKAGSRGGTIINARGSGVHETSTLFAMEIEPEKEIVLILAETHLTEAIASSIRDSLDMDKPGNGIVFIQDVSKTYGLLT